MSSAICFNLDQSKTLSPGNGLTPEAIFTIKIALCGQYKTRLESKKCAALSNSLKLFRWMSAMSIIMLYSPLPNDKILDLKEFANDQFTVIKMRTSLFDK